MPNSFDSPAKRHIRSAWGKPLLKFLYETLNSKLIYLGLPSENPEDIYEWVDYLDEVYAFQCREYPNPSEENQSRAKVVLLESKLRELETQNKLSYSVVFDGYIEEVVLNGFDNNPQPTTFGHENTITVYNLDFCNQISTPIKYKKDGVIQTAYKFDAVKELLRYQSQIHQLPKKFVLFLTINAQYSDEHVTQLVQSDFRDYYNDVSRLGGIETRSRVLKAYVFKVMRDAFGHYGFIPEFLPVIRYKGVNTGNNKNILLHFTIVGTYNTPSPGGVSISQQADRFLKQKFVSVEDGNFVPLTYNETFTETNPKTNPIELFQKTQVFKRFWQKPVEEKK